MNFHFLGLVLALFLLTPLPGQAAEGSPEKVAIPPGKDLSILRVAAKRGSGFGSSVCGSGLSPAYQKGYQIGMWNHHHGVRNIVRRDDAESPPPVKDENTGFPVLLVSLAEPAGELDDQIRGYNDAMRGAAGPP